MPEFDSNVHAVFDVFGGELRQAMLDAPIPGLADGPVDARLSGLLASGEVSDSMAEIAEDRHNELLSGLWLLAGDINHSHEISQNLPSNNGSFLHGIMHRREGDFGNAKYWFRRVGEHPVVEQIANQVADGIYQDPLKFVDACSTAREGQSRARCEAAQWIEWQLLMVHMIGG